jgi:DNA repair protein RecO (recombination protein O)
VAPLHLRGAEAASFAVALAGVSLMGAFTSTKLVLNFVPGDPHPGLFIAYSQALAELRAGGDPEPALRRFELQMLAEVGYGLNLDHDVLNDVPLDPEGLYEYRLEQGPVPVAAGGAAITLSGADLLAIGSGDLSSPASLQAAKRLLRSVLPTTWTARR